MVDKLTNKFRGFAFISFHKPEGEYSDGKARVLRFQNELSRKHTIKGKPV
jgi:hypothetical protein